MKNTLGKDLLFVLSFWGGLIAGAALWVATLLTNDIERCYSVGCFNNILQIFSLPIQAAATGMALAAFRAVVYRSNQINTQIQLTTEQNTFKNYIDHKAEFVSILESLEESWSIEIKRKGYLYKNVFPKNTPSYMSIDSKEIDCDKSWLDFKLERYNKLVDSYNDLVGPYLAGSKDQAGRELSNWLAGFLLLIFELDIKMEKTILISEPYKGLFSDSDEINQVPVDIRKSFTAISQYFEQLMTYSLPSRDTLEVPKYPVSCGGRMNVYFRQFTESST